MGRVFFSPFKQSWVPPGPNTRSTNHSTIIFAHVGLNLFVTSPSMSLHLKKTITKTKNKNKQTNKKTKTWGNSISSLPTNTDLNLCKWWYIQTGTVTVTESTKKINLTEYFSEKPPVLQCPYNWKNLTRTANGKVLHTHISYRKMSVFCALSQDYQHLFEK